MKWQPLPRFDSGLVTLSLVGIPLTVPRVGCDVARQNGLLQHWRKIAPVRWFIDIVLYIDRCIRADSWGFDAFLELTFQFRSTPQRSLFSFNIAPEASNVDLCTWFFAAPQDQHRHFTASQLVTTRSSNREFISGYELNSWLSGEISQPTCVHQIRNHCGETCLRIKVDITCFPCDEIVMTKTWMDEMLHPLRHTTFRKLNSGLGVGYDQEVSCTTANTNSNFAALAAFYAR